MRDSLSALILSTGIAVGLLGAGYMVSQTKIADRYVEVKGLSEQTVKSDYASWTINYKVVSDSLENSLKAIEASQGNIIKFLSTKGFAEDEIEKGQIKITDKLANAYGGNENVNPAQRYVIESSITLHTNKVDKVVAASQQSLELAKSGVVLSSDYGNNLPGYEFKGLDKLKPTMIEAATKDARNAANKFAKDSGVGVGEIRHATQGYFSIDPLDSTQPGGGDASASLYKKVRVVSTIEFFFK